MTSVFHVGTFHSESLNNVSFWTSESDSDWTRRSGQLVDVLHHRFLLALISIIVVMALWEDQKEAASEQIHTDKPSLSNSWWLINLLLLLSSGWLPPLLLLLLCTHRCSCILTVERRRETMCSGTDWTLSDEAEGTAQTSRCLTWSLWCGDVSLVEGRSLLMSWPIVLKVGLSVGSRLQQSFISWYLRGQVC